MVTDSAFDSALALVLENEGGYSWHKDDPGGETHFGISKRSYPTLNIKNLTLEMATEIYLRDYWKPLPENLSPSAKVVGFDIAVNHGMGRLKQWVAEGHITASALTSRRLMHYTALATWGVFGRGWCIRAARVLMNAEALARL